MSRSQRNYSKKYSNDNCCVDSICDKICYPNPDDCCETKCVKHIFKVCLGECNVTRDVKVLHCITANLDHHIKENVICKHAPCTKYTRKEINTVNDSKCCKVKFPQDKLVLKNNKWRNSAKSNKYDASVASAQSQSQE